MPLKVESQFIARKYAEAKGRKAQRLVIAQRSDVLVLLVATGGGAGFAPIVPATFGSLAGVVVVCGLAVALKFEPESLQLGLFAVGIMLIPVGSWAAARAERIFRKKDAGQIVIDEVCGQVLTFVPVAALLDGANLRAGIVLLAGFVLFRLFDICKPYPLRRLEGLRDGWGVMADDVGAGVYAAVMLSLLLWFRH